MSKVITPKSERAKDNLELLAGSFSEAYDVVSEHGPISLSDLGLDWNSTTFKGVKRKGIEFSLKDFSETGEIIGNIRNIGHNEIGVNAYDIVGNMSNGYIFNSLGEAVNITSKLKIEEGLEILPQGDSQSEREYGPRQESITKEQNSEQYREFLGDVLASAKNIHIGKTNEQFGKYAVVETPSGFYLAYNTNYGNAVYIVTDFATLQKDKQSIIRDGDAIRIIRKGNWEEKLREFIKPVNDLKTA